jgi:lactoylglutathione lyase
MSVGDYPGAQAPIAALVGARMLHTMFRVRDLEQSLQFYVQRLGMRLLRRRDFVDGRFTLAFIGYGEEREVAVLELTHNWDENEYSMGTAYGHVAIGVADVYQAALALQQAGVRVTRPAGPLKGDPDEHIAFVEDPDGYKVELIQTR